MDLRTIRLISGRFLIFFCKREIHVAIIVHKGVHRDFCFDVLYCCDPVLSWPCLLDFNFRLYFFNASLLSKFWFRNFLAGSILFTSFLVSFQLKIFLRCCAFTAFLATYIFFILIFRFFFLIFWLDLCENQTCSILYINNTVPLESEPFICLKFESLSTCLGSIAI